MHSEAWHGDRPKEECGVVGVWTPGSQAAKAAFFSLQALQHRGQESAGIAVSDGQKVTMRKGMGLVGAVFTDLSDLQGETAIGHTRYSTTGASVLANAQPIHCASTVGEIAVAHNGNLVNTKELREELLAEGVQLVTTADSEVIAQILARNLHLGVVNAVSVCMKRIKGAYAVTVLTPDMVLGFRDPYGVRPLVVGRLQDGFIVASESCALVPVGGEVLNEVGPGEVVIIDKDGLRMAQAAPPQAHNLCLFELIYFARPDSRMYGSLIYDSRERMGMELAREKPADADIVIPVPDSGVPAAIGYSRVSGIPFCEGMMKNRYIHRTFIQPDQRMREMGVRMKLSPLEDRIRHQRVVLVDDSIVRATTTKQIVKMLLDQGAKEVHVRITAPPIKNPCFYGIDMASTAELAAANMTEKQICQHVGATSLGYLSIAGAVRAVGRPASEFCLACFDGRYPIEVPRDLSKMAFEQGAVGELATVTV